MSSDVVLEPRREFLAMAGAGALAFAAGTATRRVAAASSTSPDPWLRPLSGKHKMYFGATSATGGWALICAMNWLASAPAAYGDKESDFSAVIGARHFSAAMALNDSIWAKYRIAAMVNVIDPQTKAPARRNIFYKNQPGDLMFPDAALDKLQACGVVMVACGLALGVVAGLAGSQVGVGEAQAKAEFMGNLLPGVKAVPSGGLRGGARAGEGLCVLLCWVGRASIRRARAACELRRAPTASDVATPVPTVHTQSSYGPVWTSPSSPPAAAHIRFRWS